MKKNTVEKVLAIIFAIVFIIGFTACATTKRDCQGTKHTKLKNGVWL